MRVYIIEKSTEDIRVYMLAKHAGYILTAYAWHIHAVRFVL